MIQDLNFKNNVAMAFNHGLDLLVKLTDIVMAIWL